MARNDEKLSPPKIKWMVEPTYDDDGVQRSAGIDQFGKEHGDPVPLAPPVGLAVSKRDEVHAMIRDLVRQERFNQAVAEEGFETFEEAEDFEVEDGDFDPHTPYEAVFDPPVEKSGDTAPGTPSPSPTAPGDAGRAEGGARPEPAPPTPANPPPKPIPDGPPPHGT